MHFTLHNIILKYKQLFFIRTALYIYIHERVCLIYCYVNYYYCYVSEMLVPTNWVVCLLRKTLSSVQN